ncbi:hypothetical protein INR49_001715, partial [Caranx melampygus]
MEKIFSQWKKQCMNKLDQSKKGSVDQDIGHVVSLLNGCEEYFTTSSCSGRIILIDRDPESDVQKQNCTWLFVSHQKCTCDDLHSVAINSGFRNSGLTVGKTGKIIAAVRSTHGLEVPLSHKGTLLVGHEFYENLQSALTAEKLQFPDPPSPHELQHPPDRLEAGKEERSKTSVYRRRRKREQQQSDCCHGDESISVQELDGCLDLFTGQSLENNVSFLQEVTNGNKDIFI